MSKDIEITVSANSFADTIEKLINEYGNEVNEACRTVIKRVSQQTVKELKKTSPRRTGTRKAGAYAKSWAYKPVKVSGRITEYTIYNKKPGLTHLLENGHGGKSPASAKPHVKPAEDFAIKELERQIIEELEK